MQILRQSTEIIVRIGPAVAVADGFTPVTTLALSTADEAELLKANTATTTDISAATMAAITGCDGWYALTLTTTLTDTVGCLDVMINDDSLILPIYARFQVIEEAAYDAMYAASAAPATAANQTTIEGKIDTVDGVVDAILLDTAEIGAAGAGLTALATQASVDTIDANVDAILVDTGTTLPASLAIIDGNVDSILVDTAEIGVAGAGLTEAGGTGDHLTAIGSVGSVTGAVGSISGVTFPTNFGDLSISLTTGLVDITQAAADKVWGTTTRALTDKAGFTISGVKTTLDDLNDITAASVWSVSLTELSADPGVSPAASGAVLLPYMAIRNKRDTTATSDEIHKSDGTVLLTATISDDGTTFSKSKVA